MVSNIQNLDAAGLLALLVLPIIVGMYWRRRRASARVVAGLFLWADAVRDSSSQRSGDRSQAGLTFDLAIATFFAVLALGVFPPVTSSEAASRQWLATVSRVSLCFGIGILLLAVWRRVTRKSH